MSHFIDNFRYTIDQDGNVTGCAIEPIPNEIMATNEPFGWDAFNWKKVNGEWVFIYVPPVETETITL